MNVGDVYGELTFIVSVGGGKSKFSCSCGKEHIANTSSVKIGHAKSCGCYKSKKTKERFKTHGMSNTSEYQTWHRMIRRCYNPAHPDFYLYGARGLTVSQEWRESFEQFYADMGAKPLTKDGVKYSIGRIDNNKGYSADNCRWETDAEQARNHSLQVNNTTGCAGICLREEGVSCERYIARFKAADGKRYMKSFATKKYGKEEAFELAVEWRKAMMEQAVEEGIMYADTHGLPKDVKHE